VDEKPAPISFGLSRIQFGNHGNQTIAMWQLMLYLCNNGFHSWTNWLTTVTMVGDATIKTKERSLL
jgi:hypothetical protein